MARLLPFYRMEIARFSREPSALECTATQAGQGFYCRWRGCNSPNPSCVGFPWFLPLLLRFLRFCNPWIKRGLLGLPKSNTPSTLSLQTLAAPRYQPYNTIFLTTMGHQDLSPAQAQQALEKALSRYTDALRELKRLHVQGRLCSHPIWTSSGAGEQWLRDTKATQKQVIL